VSAVVGGPVDRVACVERTPDRMAELTAVRVSERDVREPGVFWRARRTAGALAGVQADVVVVVACREECG
jgi:hypothetical protein